MSKFKKDGKILTRDELKKEFPNVAFPRDINCMREWMSNNGVEEVPQRIVHPTVDYSEGGVDTFQILTDEVASLRAEVNKMKQDISEMKKPEAKEGPPPA